jgi:hypothetical protein
MEKIRFEGWKDCVELKSGEFRLVVTTEVGPRVIGGFIGDSPNIFCVFPVQAGRKGGNAWRIYGGHRLWHSPEAKPRSYAVENRKIKVKAEADGGVCFTPGPDGAGIHRSITIYPLGNERFKVEHRLRNDNVWDIELAAWALSVMAPGGAAVVPQPQGDVKALLPNRYFTLWPYTDMADKRLTWGRKFMILRQNKRAVGKCKFGMACDDGWLGYANKGVGFVKSFEHIIDAEYPDNGCSVELFTNRNMLEVESLSPLYLLAPGEEILHVEEWHGVKGVSEVKTEEDAAAFAALYKAKLARDAKGVDSAPVKKGRGSKK